MTPKPPLIVDGRGDLTFFASAADAERYLEAIDVRNGGHVAYDAEGRRLALRIEPERVPVLFGLTHAVRERVRIGEDSDEPDAPADLRRALLGFLEAVGRRPPQAEKLPLDRLVALGAEAAGLS